MSLPEAWVCFRSSKPFNTESRRRPPSLSPACSLLLTWTLRLPLRSPLGRIPAPNKEIVTLAEYRQLYAQYRSDPDLQEAHRQHPWIIVWDDHESLDLDRERVQAEWVHPRTILERTMDEEIGAVQFAGSGSNRLQQGSLGVPPAGAPPLAV